MIILTYIQQTGGDRVKYETNKRVTQTVNSTIFSYDTAAVSYVVVVVVQNCYYIHSLVIRRTQLQCAHTRRHHSALIHCKKAQSKTYDR